MAAPDETPTGLGIMGALRNVGALINREVEGAHEIAQFLQEQQPAQSGRSTLTISNAPGVPQPRFEQEPSVSASFKKSWRDLGGFDRSQHASREVYEAERNRQFSEVQNYRQRKAYEEKALELYLQAKDQWGRFDESKLRNLQQRDKLIDSMMQGALSGRNSPLEHLFADEINQRAQEVFGRDDLTITERGPNATRFNRVSDAFDALMGGPPVSTDGSLDDLALISSADTAVGDMVQRVHGAEVARMGADLAAISRDMGRPGVTQAEREDLRRQFTERWPQYAERGWLPGAITSEQYAKLQQKITLNKANSNWQRIQSGGMPDEVMTINERGQVEMAPGMREALSFQEARKRDERMFETEQRKNQNDILKYRSAQIKQMAPAPLSRVDALDPARVQAYENSMNAVNEMGSALWAKSIGETPSFSASYSLHEAIRNQIVEPGDVIQWGQGRFRIGPAPYYTPTPIDE